MKFIIQEKDISSLVGRFIVQLNNDDSNVDFTRNESNAAFMLEKRIHFVAEADGGKILSCGFFYSNKARTKENFVKYFNQEGTDRFHRLLTTSELKWLMKKIIERNF